MRILHAPSNIANQAWILAQALRARGHDAEVWHYGESAYGFPADRFVTWPSDVKSIFELIVEAVARFDVFHFHFARSLVPRDVEGLPALWDLPLLRALGKKVVVTFHGGDVRLPSVERARSPWPIPFERVDEDAIRKRVHIWRTYADALFVTSPTTLPHVPDAAVGPRAVPLDDLAYVGPVRREHPLVVHVPTQRETKGTSHILGAVDALRARGVVFDFRLLEDLPHERALDALRDADVVVDQVLVGDYGVVGIEAMALGKVVVVRLDAAVTRTFGDVPVVHADPATLPRALERIVSEVSERERLGREARAFVEKHHAPAAVAEQLEEVYGRASRPLVAGHPDWATLAEARRLERTEEQLVALRARVESGGRSVVIPGTKRGPFAMLGTKLDEGLRALKRRGRR